MLNYIWRTSTHNIWSYKTWEVDRCALLRLPMSHRYQNWEFNVRRHSWKTWEILISWTLERIFSMTMASQCKADASSWAARAAMYHLWSAWGDLTEYMIFPNSILLGSINRICAAEWESMAFGDVRIGGKGAEKIFCCVWERLFMFWRWWCGKRAMRGWRCGMMWDIGYGEDEVECGEREKRRVIIWVG